MAKRKKIIKDGFTESGLPTPEQATKATAAATGQTTNRNTYRQTGITAKGRVKFTTMINKQLRERLQATADNNSVSVADVLDHIIKKHYGIREDKPDFSK